MHRLRLYVFSAAGTGRQCLPEIAPQGHFLALRAQGATSAFGLLAMTIWGLLLFYRQPVPVVRAAPGAACLPYNAWLAALPNFPFSIFRLHLPLRCNPPPHKTQAPLRVQRGRRLSKNLSSRKFRREEKCERKPSGFPFALNNPPQRQNCKIILQNSILQFWKQLVKNPRRDFFDKLRPRCGCSGAVGDIAYSAVTIWPLTSAKRTPSVRLVRLFRSFSVSV